MHAWREFTFLWPTMLWLLLCVPLLAVFYLWLLARRKRRLPRDSALASMVRATDSTGAWRRHLPAVLLLLGLTAMVFAIARPQAVVKLPSRVDTIILAMDASGSMRATDVKPNRLAAAQDAARAFIADQPGGVRIGVVSIAAAAALVQSPTDNREEVLLQPGSALGSGVVIALATLLPHSGLDVDQIVAGSKFALPRDPQLQSEIENFKPVPPGSDPSVAIVLLSDGQSNFGPNLEAAGKLAAERGVRVFTVGLGTPEGAVLSVEGWSMRVRLDAEALRKISTVTGGEYFEASNAGDLKKIYRNVSAKLSVGKGRATEITALAIGIGVIFALAGALISVFRFSRVL
jgi:Ca-activated chloride channel family protein